MGLKLRSQIVGILFLLFTLTVMVLGYLNMTLLLDALQSLAEERCLPEAAQIMNCFNRLLPESDVGPRGSNLRVKAQQYDDSVRRCLQSVPDLRTLQILSPSGSVWYAQGPGSSRQALSRTRLEAVCTTGHSDFSLWSYDSPADLEGHAIAASTVLMPHTVTFESYQPVFSQGKMQAIYHLSFGLPDMPQRLRVMLMGNLLLAGIFVITAFVAISNWTKNAISDPLELVLRAQQQIGKGDFTANVQIDSPQTNEVVRIIASFNRMSADLRRFRKELEVKTQRLESVNLEYQRLNESLKSAVDAKTRDLQDFFGVITHDLKVPLAAIQGYVDLMGRSAGFEAGSKPGRYLRGIGTACNHLLGLTRHMMEAVAYDANKIRYYTREFDLVELLDEVSAQLATSLEEKNIVLSKQIETPCADVVGDPSKIAQVLINLLTNALKFSRTGGTLGVRMYEKGAGVAVEVSDNGVGIAPEHVPYLFEKFSQFHTVEGSSSSMGLGLYIVGKIIEGHGQQIWVESQLGEGSRFTFTLARTSAAAGEPAQTLGEDAPWDAEEHPG